MHFLKISKNLIGSAFFLPREILKNIDMPQQKPWHLPTAEANFKCWLTFLRFYLRANIKKTEALRIGHFKQSNLTEYNASRMPVNESFLRVYLMRRCHSKVIYQKCVIFYKYWKQVVVKRLLVKKLLSILQ